MKTVTIICVIISSAVTASDEFYDSVFENFDIKPIIENPRTLKNYGKCFLGQGPCSPDGLEFKREIPEAMKTACGKCSPKQRELVRIVVQAFMTKQPEIWNELVQKLDPKGEYRKEYEILFQNTN